MNSSYVTAAIVVASGHTSPPLGNVCQSNVTCLKAAGLLFGLLVQEHVTGVYDARRIDRGVAFIDVLNDAFFIDHEGGPVAETLRFVEDTIIFNDGAFEITQ